MRKYSVILLDVDGVLLKPPKFFSHSYAEERGFDKERFDKFFAQYAEDVAKGKTDYRQLIIERNDVWEWDKSPDELLEKWFSYENHKEEKLIEIVKSAKEQGLKVYLATDQDKYRAKYLVELFSDFLDGAYISSTIKHHKKEPEFFKFVVSDLANKLPNLKAGEIIYFDDAQHNIDSAKKAGISAYLYKNPEQVKKYLTS
ncbi:MAG: HAD-IA family hydrolase [Candidatus Saccharimonadales bacterium]